MAGEFPSPFRSTKDPLAQQVEKFVKKLDKLRPEKDGPGYLGNSGALRKYVFSLETKEKTMGEIIDKTKGKIKQAVGDLTGNKELKQEGENDELKGKVEGAVEDVKHAVKGAVKDVKHAIKEVTK